LGELSALEVFLIAIDFLAEGECSTIGDCLLNGGSSCQSFSDFGGFLGCKKDLGSFRRRDAHFELGKKNTLTNLNRVFEANDGIENVVLAKNFFKVFLAVDTRTRTNLYIWHMMPREREREKDMPTVSIVASY